MSCEDPSMNGVVGNKLCYICLEFLRQPVSPQCAHSFCRNCLNNYITYSTSHDINDLYIMLCGSGLDERTRDNQIKISMDKGVLEGSLNGKGRKISTESSPSQLQRFDSIPITPSQNHNHVQFNVTISSPCSSENLSQHHSSFQHNQLLSTHQDSSPTTKHSSISSSNSSFHCPVCYRSFPSSLLMTEKVTIKSSSQSTFKESHSNLVKCESCHNTTEFFCNKCNINLCLPCRQQHDSMALFKEHPVVYAVSKDNGDSLVCHRHDKKPCTYFCLNCKSALCVLCVMRHTEECLKERLETHLREEENLETNNLKNELNNIPENGVKSVVQSTTQSHYYYQQPKDQSVPNISSDNQDVNSIIKLRDAMSNVRENLKSVLNLLGSQLNRIKKKFNYFSTQNYPKNASPMLNHFSHKKSFCFISDAEHSGKNFGKFPKMLKPPRKETFKINSVFNKFRKKLHQNDETKALNVVKNIKAATTSAPGVVVGVIPVASDDSSDSDTPEEKLSSSSSTSNKHLFKGLKNKIQKGLLSTHKNDGNSDSKSDSGSVESSEGEEKQIIWRFEKVVSAYERLLSISTNALESVQAKRLYSVYEDLSDRIRVVVGTELVRVEREIDHVIRRCQHRFIHTLSTSNLSRSLRMSDADSLMEGGLDGCSIDDSHSKTTLSPSLLARPFPLWKYEKSKNVYEGTTIPCDLAYLEKEACVVVAEYDNVNNRNNRLQLIDAATGGLRSSLMEGQIHPLGIALSRDQQHIVVSDCKSKRVKIISLTTGSVVMEMGKGQFGWPYGVSVNYRGMVVVSDAFNDCILLFSPDGKKIRSFGSTGSQFEQFRNPYHLTCDSKGRIYVSDSGNNCVKVFDINGNFEFIANDASRRHYITGSEGTTERKRRRLKGPRGVAVDDRANIFVADDHNRVSMFDSQGCFTRFVLTEEDLVRYPEAVCYCTNGSLFISEWSPGNVFSVKKFSLYNKGV